MQTAHSAPAQCCAVSAHAKSVVVEKDCAGLSRDVRRTYELHVRASFYWAGSAFFDAALGFSSATDVAKSPTNELPKQTAAAMKTRKQRRVRVVVSSDISANPWQSSVRFRSLLWLLDRTSRLAASMYAYQPKADRSSVAYCARGSPCGGSSCRPKAPVRMIPKKIRPEVRGGLGRPVAEVAGFVRIWMCF